MSRKVFHMSALKRQQGLSLIELMIAMVLGLILTLGVVEIFLGSNKTYRLTDSIAKLQENLRFSLSTLSYDGRMAGHSGCLIGQPTNHVDMSSSGLDVIYNRNAVVGWEYDGTELGDAYTQSSFSTATSGWSNGTGDSVPAAISGSAIPGSDILMLNTADLTNVEIDGGGGNASTIGTTDATGIPQGSIVLVIAGDCSGGDMFQNTDNANASTMTRGNGGTPGNTNSENLGSYDDNASVYTFRSTAYYIGVGTGGEPSLFRERLDAGDTSSGAVELLQGVENMQLLYGVANGSDKEAARYVPADSVTDWSRVVSFRVALLMRSDDIRTDTEESQVSNLVGTKITSPSDRRARLVGTTTVGIRNRLQ